METKFRSNFYPDNVGNSFIQNFIAFLPNYTASRPRKYSNIHAYRHDNLKS